MTLTSDGVVEHKIIQLMVGSHKALVNYETPLDLTHLMGTPHHMPRPSIRGPYHGADANGLGFDRTMSGSTGVGCYQPGARDVYADLKACPEKYLLWFHHVPWDHPMASGKPMWDEFCPRYQSGVNWVQQARKTWDGFSGKLDPEQHRLVAQLFATQEEDAKHWRNVCLAYFKSHSQRPFPDPVVVIPETDK